MKENRLIVAFGYCFAGMLVLVILGFIRDMFSLPVFFDTDYQVVISGGIILGLGAGPFGKRWEFFSIGTWKYAAFITCVPVVATLVLKISAGQMMDIATADFWLASAYFIGALLIVTGAGAMYLIKGLSSPNEPE